MNAPNVSSLPESPPLPDERSDTTYFCVADAWGNRVSFINSLFDAFGSGVVAGDTGIACQNRGSSFFLDPSHINALRPGLRPMHTLIPAMVLKDGAPRYTLGCIGGDQQAQGLLQILQRLLDDGEPIDDAVSGPRFRSLENNQLSLEPPLRVYKEALRSRGHELTRAEFYGGCQIIEDRPDGLAAFSDPRVGGEACGG